MKKRGRIASGTRRRTRAKARKGSGKPKSRKVSKKSGARSRIKKPVRSGTKRVSRSRMQKPVRSGRSRKHARLSRKPNARAKRRVLFPEKARRPSSRPESMLMDPLEQVKVKCSNCNRQFSIVKIPNLKIEGMICQRCSVGEIQFPD